MNKAKIIFILLIFISFKNIKCLPFKNSEKIIISLTSDLNNIYNTEQVINSIIEQNINHDFYEILLILSFNENQNFSMLPKTIRLLMQSKKIRILLVKESLTEQKRTLITMKKYPNNPILIINNICKLPFGWLEMFIKDHIRYPNDAITASIQYCFDKNFQVSELKEGFDGNKFGIFNHVSEIIFNFGIINIDLGGILYPKNFFKNVLFYDHNLFLKSTMNSEDFWQSAFIIMENKILRQSSKIFDFTNYLLEGFNYQEYNSNKKKILEKSKILLLAQFHNFNDDIKKRQSKIIVSFASYPERFIYLPDLMKFIKNQSFPINKIVLSFYKEHKKFYNLNISDINIIYAEKNLKPHLKYYYTMQLFRDYAIITLDDDLGYSYDTFESLFNAYVENPNIINGRRAHLMTFKKSGELKPYMCWIFQYRNINKSDFNLTLTNGAGSIFPPDILNINEEFLPIINETITCDDLTLKHFAVKKGIPHKWIINNNIMGIPRRLPNSKSVPLFNINSKKNNDICINKLNIIINNIILKNLCVPYRNLTTGNTIYLYDIHNKIAIYSKFSFDIFAYSYCPINNNLKFKIFFNNTTAQCFIKKYKNIYLDNNIKIASCEMDKFNQDLDYFFPKAYSNENIKIKIFNYRKYLTIIFNNFICNELNNCFLEVLLYENISFSQYPLKIENKYYLCNLFDKIDYSYVIFPIIIRFKCSYLNSSNDIILRDKNIISGLPSKIKILNKSLENEIRLYKFVINRMSLDKENKNLILNGKFEGDLKNDFYYILLNLIYPNITLNCSLTAYSKYVQSTIFCEVNNITIKEDEILIENQIVTLINNQSNLLLINEETMIKIKFNKINKMKNQRSIIHENRNQLKIIYLQIYILLIIIIIKVKFFCLKIY